MVRINLQRFLIGVFIVVAIGAIIGVLKNNMSVVNWGLLAKSLVDPEKIEEAINRLVAEHEADPDSHLGTGESLQSHRAEEIIDHVVGSVLADKLSHTEIIHKSSFEVLDGWSRAGTVEIVGLGCVTLYVVYPDVQDSLLRGSLAAPAGWMNYDKNMLLQFIAWIDGVIGVYQWAVFGINPTTNNFSGFGFYIEQGVVKGVWGKGANPTFTADLGIDPIVPHVYRCNYDATAKEMQFYVDGILKAVIEDIAPVAPPADYITFNNHVMPAVYESYLYLQEVMISRQI